MLITATMLKKAENEKVHNLQIKKCTSRCIILQITRLRKATHISEPQKYFNVLM